VKYAVITPVRDEVENLPRLAASLVAQTQPPCEWIIVDNGSSDGTRSVAGGLSATHPWITSLAIEAGSRARGAPIVRSFNAGLAHLRDQGPPDIVVSVDADISFDPDYFARLLESFAADRALGIASGTGCELRRGQWRPRHLTGTTVWGASRAYRWACLEAVLPLEERLGWDGIDEFKANAAGWRTQIVRDIAFRHHRKEGSRDGGWRSRVEQGRFAHYVGYRPSYVAARAAFNALRDPAGPGLLWGYATASLAHRPRLGDERARAYVRSQQRLRHLPLRALEALGRR
jgi:poly-beta-1,6-N-acetyl-D-glucosamine synthase